MRRAPSGYHWSQHTCTPNLPVSYTHLDVYKRQIYTPTPGEKDIELNAPENVLPFLEVYVNKNGTLFVNMKHFADISSDTPFSIELKAPPMDTFHNKGTGTLILKDGAYSCLLYTSLLSEDSYLCTHNYTRNIRLMYGIAI